MKTTEFMQKLGRFLKRELKTVRPLSVDYDALPTAEPGDPADLE